MVTHTWGINIDSSCHMTTDPNMAPGSSMDLDVPMALGGSTGYSDQRAPPPPVSTSKQQEPYISTWSPVSAPTTDVCLAFGGNSTDMALGGSLVQDHTMVSSYPSIPHWCQISGSIFSTVSPSLSFSFSSISPHAFHLSCLPIIHLSIIVIPVANAWVPFFQLYQLLWLEQALGCLSSGLPWLLWS